MLANDLRLESGSHGQPVNGPTESNGTERRRFAPSPLPSDSVVGNLVATLTSLS